MKLQLGILIQLLTVLIPPIAHPKCHLVQPGSYIRSACHNTQLIQSVSRVSGLTIVSVRLVWWIGGHDFDCVTDLPDARSSFEDDAHVTGCPDCRMSWGLSFDSIVSVVDKYL